MSYCLFLDDERDPPDDGKTWRIARSFDGAVALIEADPTVNHISFDHDLGAGPTGYDLAKWLVERALDGKFEFPPAFSFYVHSQNPIGKKNIELYLGAFLDQL